MIKEYKIDENIKREIENTQYKNILNGKREHGF